MGLSRPPSDTLSHSASQRETVGGWENTRREALTRRLSYHGIRSGLWETAPPKHTCTLSVKHTQTHANTPAHTQATLLHTKSHQGKPEGRLRKAAGHTPVSNKCLLIPFSFLALTGLSSFVEICAELYAHSQWGILAIEAGWSG